MKLRAAQGKLKIEHSIIDGLRPVLERLLRDQSGIRSIIPGVIRPVRDARGPASIRITVPTTNGWKAIALSAEPGKSCSSAPLFQKKNSRNC